MSRFTRAFEGALRAEGLSQAEAAATAGVHPSTLSRIVSGEMEGSAEYVGRLLHSLPKESDRHHCLREWIFDQVPEEYWPNLMVNFGIAYEEVLQRPADELTEALQTLEVAGSSDPDLRILVKKLAAVLAPPKKKVRRNGPKGTPTAPTAGGGAASGAIPPLPEQRGVG